MRFIKIKRFNPIRSVFPSTPNIIILSGSRSVLPTLIQIYYFSPNSLFSLQVQQPCFIFPSIYSLTLSAAPFFPPALSSSHLILWINSFGVALPRGWQALWLKGLLARCKWEADCHFEASRGSLLPARGRGGPPTWKRKEKKKAMGDVRNESLGAAAQLTNHFLYSHIHIHQENPRWVVCVTSVPPPFLPALLIRQVTTVRFLALGQRRHSLASGTWNSNPDSLWLSPPIALTIPHPLEKQEYHVMGRKEAEWAVIGKVSPQNKHVMVDLVLVRKMA